MTSAANTQSARRQLLAALPVGERRLELDGVRTAVLVGGDGPPVVLLHGPMAHAAHWMDVIPGLARDHGVIAPDLPGHGASELGGAPLDVPRIMAWLGALISRTCKTRPALVGQLMGGAIALRFAIEHGDLVERLVLIDTFGLAPLRPAPAFAAALRSFESAPDADTHDGLWRYCAFDFDRLRSRMGERWSAFAAYNVEGARSPAMRDAMQALMPAFAFTAIPTDQLARIRVPASLIWGRHDLATPLAVAEAASRRHGWPLQIIENAADDPPVEQPEAVLQALRQSLADPERVPSA